MSNVIPLKKPRAKKIPDLLQLKIELAWIKPTIWRRIVVPESITLGNLLRSCKSPSTGATTTCTNSTLVASASAFPIRNSIGSRFARRHVSSSRPPWAA
jgi:hypothetical protein